VLSNPHTLSFVYDTKWLALQENLLTLASTCGIFLLASEVYTAPFTPFALHPGATPVVTHTGRTSGPDKTNWSRVVPQALCVCCFVVISLLAPIVLSVLMGPANADMLDILETRSCNEPGSTQRVNNIEGHLSTIYRSWRNALGQEE